MAREEHDREDLLREATALVQRVQLIVPGCDDEVFAGFRREGSASFYFGQRCAFHFNSEGRLRRAFVAGRLLKAEQGRLVALRRNRTASEVELLRHELTDDETTALLKSCGDRLKLLRDALAAGTHQVVGQVPQGVDVVDKVLAWVNDHAAHVTIADSPRSA
jgi:hypothetical protein